MHILLVEEEATLARTLESVFQQSVNVRVDVANGARQLFRVFDPTHHSVVIMDWSRDGTAPSAPSLSRRLRRTSQTVGIVFATARGDTCDKLEAFRAGADLYLVKPFDPRELVAQVQALGRRATPTVPASPRDTNVIAPEPAASDEVPQLTAQQREILRNVATGLSNKEIAVELRCSVKNIEYHVGNLLRKTSCSTRSELVSWNWRQRLHARAR